MDQQQHRHRRPADQISLDESITTALAVVLHTLSPAQRVAFMLHDVLAIPFREVAAVLDRSEDACRQLAVAARRRVRTTSPPGRSAGQLAGAAAELKRAWDARDLAALVRVLNPHVQAITDGGGHVTAALAPINGAEAVARLLLDAAQRQPDLVVQQAQVSGEPALITRNADGRVLAVISIDLNHTGIDHLWVVRNPEKLRRWHPTTTTRHHTG